MTTIKSLSSWLLDPSRKMANFFLEASALGVELVPIHQAEKIEKRADTNLFLLNEKPTALNFAWKTQQPLVADRYHLAIDFPNGWHSLHAPHLYFDKGEGFSDRESKQLYFIDSSKKQATALLTLTSGKLALRFEPIITLDENAIGKVTLRRIPALIYYFGLAAKLARNQLTNPRQLFRSILCVMRTFLRRGAHGLALRFDQLAARLANYDYAHWAAEFDTLTTSDRRMIAHHIAALPSITIEVIWSLKSQDIEHMTSAIECLKYQLHKRWQATVIVPTTSDLAVALDAAKGEEHIRIITADDPIAHQPEQHACATLLIAGKVLLRDHALYLFAHEAFKGATFVYADEDLLMDNGRRAKPFFKPNYSPELARNTPYFGSCILVQHVAPNVFSAMKDVALRDMEFAHVIEGLAPHAFSKVAHIPFVLFSDNERCARASLQDRTLPWLTEPLPKVSIIIPTRDREDLLRPCIESILKKTEYPRDHYEIIVIDNGSSKLNALSYLKHIENMQNIIILRDTGKFNYSRLNNRAVAIATGEVLVFLNNDTVIEDPKWLHQFAFYTKTADIGVVGGKLLFPDRTVQHGGVVMGINGTPKHAHRGVADGGYENLCNLTHEVSAVTAACCAIHRSVFLEIGGFDENLAVAYNDILLCLDALNLGYRNIYIGRALIIHYESKSRGRDNTLEKRVRAEKECAYTRSKHPAKFFDDRYYSPNLSLGKTYEFAFPPRRIKPWLDFQRSKTRKLRILLLSDTHQIGQQISTAIAQQAISLIDAGHHVIIGGPAGSNEHSYENCERLILDDAIQSAEIACKSDIDCVISYTPPFYSTARWLGPHIKSIIFDYGDAAQKDYTNAKAWHIQHEKERSLSMADAVYKVASLDIEKSARDNCENSLNQIVNTVESLCLANATMTIPCSAEHTPTL